MALRAKIDAVVYRDVALPVEHAGRCRQPTPERRLMIAVLEDAIHCVTKYRFATDGPGRRLFAQETQWLLSEDDQWPYSFACICDALDLDAAAVRQGLRLTYGSTTRPRGGRGRSERTAAVRYRSEPRRSRSALAFTAEG